MALNSQPIWFESGATRIVYSDASDTGYGGYSVEVGPHIAQGSWSKHEANLSSTWRELKAVYRVLCSLAPNLKGHVVKWFSDNQNVTLIVHAGIVGSSICRMVLWPSLRYVFSMGSNWTWSGS